MVWAYQDSRAFVVFQIARCGDFCDGDGWLRTNDFTCFIVHNAHTSIDHEAVRRALKHTSCNSLTRPPSDHTMQASGIFSPSAIPGPEQEVVNAKASLSLSSGDLKKSEIDAFSTSKSPVTRSMVSSNRLEN